MNTCPAGLEGGNIPRSVREEKTCPTGSGGVNMH